MKTFRLSVRTPSSLAIDVQALRVRAEDRDGWFGVRPGHAEVVAVLPPGLLVYEDDEGEGFVAVGGGLLHADGATCDVMVSDAIASRDVEALGAEVARYAERRRARAAREREIVGELAKEVLRRLTQEAKR